MKLYFFYLLASFLVITGCKKDNASGSDPLVSPALVFVKAKQSAGNIILNENKYNAGGDIQTRISYKDYTSGLLSAKADYLYDGNRLTQIDEQSDYSSSSYTGAYLYTRSTFEYSNNRISQRNNFMKVNDQYELRSFAVFEYNDAGLPVKETRYTADGALTGYNIYEYSSEGNVITSTQYGINNLSSIPVLTFKYNYKHDHNKNPYKSVYNLIENIPFSVNSNNIIQTSFSNYNINSSNPQISTTQTTYTYNNKNLPAYMNENGNEFLLEYQ